MKKLLIVVDYQNDFVDGTLGFEKAKLLEDKLETKILDYIYEKQDVLFTLDTHQEDYLNTFEGKNLPVKHCIDGTEGHFVYGKIFKYSRMFPNIKKNTFGSKDLLKYLEDKDYDLIELVGVVTNMCVLANAVICQSALPNSKIVVCKDLVAALDDEIENQCFNLLEKIFIEVK